MIRLLRYYFLFIETIKLWHLKLWRRGRFENLKHMGMKATTNPFGGEISLKNPQYMYIKGHIGNHCVLECWDKYMEQKFLPILEIGEKTSIGEYTHITCISQIIIGKGVLTGRYILISDNNHGIPGNIEELAIPPAKRQLSSKGPIIIEDNVWIGDRAVILGGVTIGEGAIIAANAVVTKNIPAGAIVVGNPGRIIKRDNLSR